MWHDFTRISAQRRIPPHRVNELAKQKKVKRKKQPKAGRPAVYSAEVKQTCLDMLAQGKTPLQIEQLMGVGAGQIRTWYKNCIPQTENNL